jgi:hypothetical protein
LSEIVGVASLCCDCVRACALRICAFADIMNEDSDHDKARGFAVSFQIEQAADAIDAARRGVAEADRARSKGASVDVWNRANAKLAAEHARFNEIAGGRVPDDR